MTVREFIRAVEFEAAYQLIRAAWADDRTMTREQYGAHIMKMARTIKH